MTIFHVLKYPISDTFIPTKGVEGLAAVKKDFPELYNKWAAIGWRLRIGQNRFWPSEPEDVSKYVNDLRRLLLQHDDTE